MHFETKSPIIGAAVTLLIVASGGAQGASSCNPFDSTLVEYSSNFHQPAPPLLQTEFQASWNQHKWDVDVSHIASGFLYNSPAHAKVRADTTFKGAIQSSIFDYNNVTKTGLVSNVVTKFSPTERSATVTFDDFVNSDFPLFSADLLRTEQGVFEGMVERPRNGRVAAWSILYQQAIPVTVYINSCNFIVGYDYFAPARRTRVTTEFFNIISGKVDATMFKY